MSDAAHAGESPPESLLRGYSGQILISLSLGWGVIQTARFLLPPLLPTIMSDLGISLAATGAILTAMQVVYALTMYPTGRLSDRLSRATLIVPGLLLLSVAIALLSWVPGAAVFLAAVMVFGVGKGFFSIPARALLSDHFVGRRGRALGVFGAATDVAGVVASAVAAVVLSVATWRAPFAALAAGLFVMTLLFVSRNREPYTVESVDLDAVSTARRILTTPSQRRTLLAYVLFFFSLNGTLNFLPAYLQAAKGFSPALASTAFAVLFVVGMAVKPASGALSDRLPRRVVAVGALALGSIALSAVVVAGSLAGVLAAVVAYAVGYKSQLPVVNAIVLDMAPEGGAGGDLGAARTLFNGIGATGAAFVGVVAGAYSYTVAFGGLAAALLASAAILAYETRQVRVRG